MTHFKNEVFKLTEDFDRLQSIFELSKNSSSKDNHSRDIELSEVRDQFKAAKEENVYLKEKNDTLFKLGKMAIDKANIKEPILEIIEDEDQDGLDALVQSVIENKRNLNSHPHRKVASNVKQANQKIPDTETHPNGSHETSSLSTKEKSPAVRSPRQRYCHYFSNFGNCKYEIDSGKTCKFLHVKAPLCKFDGSCDRQKCMFSHHKQSKAQDLRQSNQKSQSPPSHDGTQSYHHLQSPFFPPGLIAWPNLQQPPPPPPVWQLHQMWDSLVKHLKQ